MTATNVTQEQIDEMKALIESGDASIADAREIYRVHRKRETLLTDEDVIKAMAAQTDDDDEELVRLMMELEEKDPANPEKQAAE